ncbi:hypothetical protein CONPUDRAFT_75424 [Coniophora puteana RWD-64-598 SS2]|uniref:Uncharacterized protein n=1 Tax=Coniophora puteana (strain RWD-64-598) TaxID=741705 RepID=A0A5M3ME69_CONPW|nr:uncharacterized protein CONPUDRAFT_75424 [Coniophora puteana RWD-64-598 SS2]EIW77569.1 hypothetical protein CONPUDRAFT_75424 [Coniophora puteana RWD-64-598 SS2]
MTSGHRRTNNPGHEADNEDLPSVPSKRRRTTPATFNTKPKPNTSRKQYKDHRQRASTAEPAPALPLRRSRRRAEKDFKVADLIDILNLAEQGKAKISGDASASESANRTKNMVYAHGEEITHRVTPLSDASVIAVESESSLVAFNETADLTPPQPEETPTEICTERSDEKTPIGRSQPEQEAPIDFPLTEDIMEAPPALPLPFPALPSVAEGLDGQVQDDSIDQTLDWAALCLPDPGLSDKKEPDPINLPQASIVYAANTARQEYRRHLVEAYKYYNRILAAQHALQRHRHFLSAQSDINKKRSLSKIPKKIATATTKEVKERAMKRLARWQQEQELHASMERLGSLSLE